MISTDPFPFCVTISDQFKSEVESGYNVNIKGIVMKLKKFVLPAKYFFLYMFEGVVLMLHGLVISTSRIPKPPPI